MRFKIPEGYKPLLVAIVIGGLAYAIYIANDVFGEPSVGPCCATEWDPTPYQQVPARTLEP